jgi:hypothetical protein
MPITKSRLTKAGEASYLQCLKELRVAGCDVELPSEFLQETCDLDILLGGGLSSRVVQGPTGGTYYAVWIRMVARHSHLTLLACNIETLWDDQIELQSFHLRESIYRLGCLHYPAKEVLNDRIENYLSFNYRGQLVEGVILFSGLKPIPDQYCEGMSVPFKLTFLNQFEKEISVESELLVERRANRKSEGMRLSSGLYEPEIPESSAVTLDSNSVEETRSVN